MGEQFESEFVNKLDVKKEFKRIDEATAELKKISDKHAKSASEQKEYLKDLKKKLDEKSSKRSLEKLEEQMKTYASYKDLKELYNKVVPQLAEFERIMNEFKNNHHQQE